MDKSGDLQNWAALVIEIGIGIIITFTVYFTQKNQQDRLQKIIDEQEKFRKEQHDFAIHRTRSYLGSLYSAIDALMKLDIDPNIPENKEMDFLLDFKNQMVTQLEHIVNQSGTILEQDYLQRLTDIIELSRINPKPDETDEGLFYLDDSHCQGILSQIDDTLKIIPNPPI